MAFDSKTEVRCLGIQSHFWKYPACEQVLQLTHIQSESLRSRGYNFPGFLLLVVKTSISISRAHKQIKANFNVPLFVDILSMEF